MQYELEPVNSILLLNLEQFPAHEINQIADHRLREIISSSCDLLLVENAPPPPAQQQLQYLAQGHFDMAEPCQQGPNPSCSVEGRPLKPLDYPGTETTKPPCQSFNRHSFVFCRFQTIPLTP